jgi:hypothetical protein
VSPSDLIVLLLSLFIVPMYLIFANVEDEELAARCARSLSSRLGIRGALGPPSQLSLGGKSLCVRVRGCVGVCTI